MPKTHEFRVRPVTRYVVTEYVDTDALRNSRPLGEFQVLEHANDIADALAAMYGGKSFPLNEENEEAA